MTRLRALLQDNSKEVHRFLKFSVVGIIGAVIDFGLLNILVRFAGVPKFWANACSFSVAVISNFTWNRHWTYPESRQRPIGPQLGQFALVNVVGLALNQAIFVSLDRLVLGETGALSAPMSSLAGSIGLAHFTLSYNLAKACAIAVVLFWNFGANRLWTYRGL